MEPLAPIGIYHSVQMHPYEAARQPRGDVRGEVTLRSGENFEQALEGLEGFERIWLIFQFHHNPDWKPKVMPPRGSGKKVGLFATRSPYRPNAIGLSCVRLIEINKLGLIVAGADLLDGTPVLDIKPYLPEADAFPDSRIGWLEGIGEERFHLDWTADALASAEWLRREGVTQLEIFLQQQLEFSPTDSRRKRVKPAGENFVIAYRTWRARFSVEERRVRIIEIFSGYTIDDLAGSEDRWQDKELHRRFNHRAPGKTTVMT